MNTLIETVKEIEARYEEKFGKIQECCRLYKDYCRCQTEETQKGSAKVEDK